MRFSYHNQQFHLEVPKANARHQFRGPFCYTVAAQLTVRFIAKYLGTTTTYHSITFKIPNTD